MVGGIFFLQPVQCKTKILVHGEACARSHQQAQQGYLSSGLLPIDHQEPLTGWESRTVKPCIKYCNMHVCLCLRALLILLNVNNNKWFLPQDTSEPLKLCFIYVSTGAGCVEKADIASKSLDTKREGGRCTGKVAENDQRYKSISLSEVIWSCLFGSLQWTFCFPETDKIHLCSC